MITIEIKNNNISIITKHDEEYIKNYINSVAHIQQTGVQNKLRNQLLNILNKIPDIKIKDVIKHLNIRYSGVIIVTLQKNKINDLIPIYWYKHNVITKINWNKINKIISNGIKHKNIELYHLGVVMGLKKPFTQLFNKSVTLQFKNQLHIYVKHRDIVKFWEDATEQSDIINNKILEHNFIEVANTLKKNTTSSITKNHLNVLLQYIKSKLDIKNKSHIHILSKLIKISHNYIKYAPTLNKQLEEISNKSYLSIHDTINAHTNFISNETLKKENHEYINLWLLDFKQIDKKYYPLFLDMHSYAYSKQFFIAKYLNDSKELSSLIKQYAKIPEVIIGIPALFPENYTKQEKQKILRYIDKHYNESIKRNIEKLANKYNLPIDNQIEKAFVKNNI